MIQSAEMTQSITNVQIAAQSPEIDDSGHKQLRQSHHHWYFHRLG